ncbi:MAG: ATPase, T2SS/T4P/T4SS family, partial [Planctomycetota bacterium]
VFSTLHTNDAASAFTRLGDMGVEPFLVSSTVEGIMAQRLVRRLCKHCRRAIDLEAARPKLAADLLPHLNEDTTIYEAVGCRECRSTGYSGRMGIYELLVVDDEIRNQANERIPSNVLKRMAIDKGMTTLRQDGWNKVVQGVTTIDEVLRVTKED